MSHQDFDSRDYLNRYYRTVEGHDDENYDSFFFKEHIKAMNHPGVNVGSGSLIDIGVGPTVHTALISSKKFSQITLSEYADQNIDEVNKWIKNDPEAHDWSDITAFIAMKEGVDPATIVSRTRNAIQECIRVDVHKDNVLEPRVFESKFDCLVSSLCLEAACSDLEAYDRAIKNLNKLVKVGGNFILMGVLEETFYTVGDKKWPVLALSENDIIQTLIGNKHKIVYFNSLCLNNPENETSDMKGLFFLISEKLE